MKMLATGAIFGDEVYIGNLTALTAARRASPRRFPTTRRAFRSGRASLTNAMCARAAIIRSATASTRERRRAGVRLRENSVGARVPAQQRRLVAPHLHRDARERLSEPAIKHPLLGQDGIDRPGWQAACASQRRRQGAGVRAETLGRLAALEATIAGLVARQIEEACENWPDGFVTPNRRMVYATLNWCQEHHTEIIDILRTLAGAAPLQMPASVDLFADPELKDRCSSAGGHRQHARGRALQALQAGLGSIGSNSPAATCSTSAFTAATRSSCATRATAKRPGTNSTASWTGCSMLCRCQGLIAGICHATPVWTAIRWSRPVHTRAAFLVAPLSY